ncbi:THO complex subunit 4B-like isoform X3 [Panicum virgatum]|uniref:THO complex subunit 4B-like isoform X3 n=1 Tax=Panicum virgatum TaxID=38727 RepID=UPI0019D5759D|nr:THO complex subunit 4B-like isoform X3 [Panicum virgatum]
MAGALDMSLDDLISKNKKTQPRPSGRGPTSGGGGPAPTAPRRRFNARAAAAPYHRGTTFPFQARRPMAYAGYGAAQPQPPMDAPTKLYISNLDYGVSNDDIKELFSDVGDIQRYSINYDRSGRSKGTAEVVFSRRSDAVAAVKRYNNVQLDGKPMKIEIIGTNIEAPAPPTATFSFNPPPGNFNVPFKSRPGRGGDGGWPRGRGGFTGRGLGGYGSRGRGRGGRGSEKVSAEDLDADLDKYHAAAMETS